MQQFGVTLNAGSSRATTYLACLLARSCEGKKRGPPNRAARHYDLVTPPPCLSNLAAASAAARPGLRWLVADADVVDRVIDSRGDGELGAAGLIHVDGFAILGDNRYGADVAAR